MKDGGKAGMEEKNTYVCPSYSNTASQPIWSVRLRRIAIESVTAQCRIFGEGKQKGNKRYKVQEKEVGT